MFLGGGIAVTLTLLVLPSSSCAAASDTVQSPCINLVSRPGEQHHRLQMSQQTTSSCLALQLHRLRQEAQYSR